MIDEKQKLVEWAQSIKHDSTRNEYIKKETAFIYCDKQYDYMEYGFSTVAELESQLRTLWGEMDEYSGISLLCAIAAYKKRHVLNNKKKNIPDDVIRVI